MGRWRPDARERLEQAAIELFSTQGFAATTVPQIAARAGLTTRTFFRHFADKREVLYGGDEIPESAAQLIMDAPASLDPATLLLGGLQTVAETRFEGRREDIRLRRAIIRSDEGLRERDLRKRADLGEAIRAGLTGRGVDATTATLLAETAVTVIQVALEEWLDSGDRTLFEVMQDTIGSLQATLATFPPFPAGPASRQAGHVQEGTPPSA